MRHIEVNFDGLVGPTHNYAGLSLGNIASEKNAMTISNPKKAAKQGIKKIRTLMELGIPQALLPPQDRPNIKLLRRFGFNGTNEKILKQAYNTAPEIFRACCSAACMWVANAATISSSINTCDGRVHITPANLQNQFHRCQEQTTTARALKAIFQDSHYFCHHDPLPGHEAFGDEGAANHMYLYTGENGPGVEIFVYGCSQIKPNLPHPKRYPARQTLEASEAIARLHGLNDDVCLFIQQNPHVIDQGVFHNDVIATSHHNLLLCHEQAFVHQEQVYAQIRGKFSETALNIVEISTEQLSVKDTVSSYLFNSQIVSTNTENMVLIAPIECQENKAVSSCIEAILADTSHCLNQVIFVDLRQSMKNGGGPACLRLRACLTPTEYKQMNQGCLMTWEKLDILENWVDKYYRDQLTRSDLSDPELLDASRCALDALTQLLNLGSIYDFQRI